MRWTTRNGASFAKLQCLYQRIACCIIKSLRCDRQTGNRALREHSRAKHRSPFSPPDQSRAPTGATKIPIARLHPAG